MTNSSDFREWGKEMVDYIADYMDGVSERPPLSKVKPGYLRSLIPDEAPQYPDKWQDVMQDIERVIMPGVSYRLASKSVIVAFSQVFSALLQINLRLLCGDFCFRG